LGRRFSASQASWHALPLRDVMKSFVTPAWRRLDMVVRGEENMIGDEGV
jgi:hypothetical protein